MLRGDLHIHTRYSFDSPTEPLTIVETAIKKGLDFIAVTDHATIRGGLETLERAKGTGLQVIVGAEIKTEKDDIIGLFLKEELKNRKAGDVIDEIHQQGGLAVFPHPFKKELRLTPEEIQKIDAIEVNGRLSRAQNEKAVNLAREYNKPLVGGSDAHFFWEIGKIVNNLQSEGPLSQSLLQAEVEGINNPDGGFANILLSVFVAKIKRYRRMTGSGEKQ